MSQTSPQPAIMPNDPLMELIRGHIPKEADHIRELLEPYYQIAKSGQYPFAPKNELDAELIARVIQRAFGLETPPEIAFVLVSDSFSRPECGAEETYIQHLDKLRTSLRVSLRESLWDSLRESLWDSLWDRLWTNLRVSLRESLWVSLWENLFFYLGFMLAGDAEAAARLEPLVQLQTRCIVLGSMREDPSVWLVACL